MKETKTKSWWCSTSDYNKHWLEEAFENVVRANPPPPLEYYRCEKCGTLFDEGKKNLCKRCYIRKYGEWSNQ